MSRSRTPAVRTLRAADPRSLVVELAVVVATLVALEAYVNLTDAVVRPVEDAVGASTGIDPHLARAVVQSLLVLGGLGVLAAVAVSERDLRFPLSLPERDAAGLVGVAMSGAAVLAGLQLLPVLVTGGLAVGDITAAVAGLPGQLTGRTLVFLAVFVAGMAVLYHGVVQGLLRRAVGTERAVAATTLLSAYFATPRFGPSAGAVRGGPWLDVSATRAGLAVLVVLTLAVAVYAAERVDDRRVRAAATVPVVAAVALATVSFWQGVDLPWEALTAATRIALVGVAACVYADTESLLAPAMVYGSYALVSLVVQSAAFHAIFVG
ncbi:hypothetical protein C475_04071 [Halosimplex carlsbadense 2-9-1]|uniref:Uncharacterized protein n=1 Tax=Halosimplex carlsbadense 2-9-1 TaxID=797114 RepID=M0D259_9EURY|nr:hypothetical protein [Halosimplex carlsbadense]ELZ28782.1 hypothetical protein C475_04071 [Halosimplex carlsbadense 2-9-1]